MKILKFSLGGRTAIFKKPEVNTYYSFTYGNIHKIVLMGIFGAVLGYKGYADTKSNDEGFPEFYKKLRDIKYSIIPKAKAGFINKKIQMFNNSVGYASKELGGNLIVKEQWLENPKWDILIKLDSEISLSLADALINRRCVYIPYLGKNDHPADIGNVTLLDSFSLTNEYWRIDSLFLKKLVEYADIEDYEEKYEEVNIFKYEESLPVRLDENSHMYYHDTFVNTNLPILKYHGEVYKVDGKNIVFN